MSPPKAISPIETNAREVETDDDDKEAPEAVVPKPAKPAEKKKPLTPPKEPARPATKPQTKPVAVVKPTPAPKPKFVYTGGSSNQPSGNDADSWNKSTGEGISGGKGDQGRVGGNPASDSYQGGGSGRSGVSIQKGLSGRRITRYPSFEDDFNENAKVAVDIRVDANGQVISAVFQPRGSTTNDMAMRNIAVNKARQLRFNVQPDGPEADFGTIVFNFKVR